MPSPILKKINIAKVIERAVEFYKMSDKNLNLKIIKLKSKISILMVIAINYIESF